MTENSPASWPALRVAYNVTATNLYDLDARVESLLLEQTVELPRAALRDPFVLENIVGRLVSNSVISHDRHRVVIDFPISATGDDPAQFLNVLFGNSSIQEHVQLADFQLPAPKDWPAREKALPGPQFGAPGLRRLVSVRDRALTSTALKPIGLTTERLAVLCSLFARAGIDIIKDDHGLANQGFHPFAERLRACQRAVREANQATGRQSIYVPNLMGTPTTVLEQLKLAQDEGVCAVMVAPMLLGLPFMAEIVREHASVPVIAHPSFGGATRILPELLYGKLLPLYGADATIFANYGGRFAYSRDTCRALADALVKPTEPGVLPTFPMPAGGIKYGDVADVLGFYGREVILLIGGGLYEAGDDLALYARAQEFVRHVAEARG
ncbi:MAG TPA: RuBisCO large subunit C-terminal-like domain-containing protein [Candidatus Methylacidiphilales bacterium]|jgi:ribulose-bisphosphate carboxylase large chain|nr:RuBisCO large subunit C-terminal-like domain-containing protein [Candidatus Methylacidiphilales bacterium]